MSAEYNDNKIQEHIGGNILEPLILSESEQKLCDLLDEKIFVSQFPPSDMLKGAIWATRPENIHNPDRIAQAANSIREILYPFKRNWKKNLNSKVAGTLSKNDIKEIDKIYLYFQNMTHHNNNEISNDFKKRLEEFKEIMINALDKYEIVYKKMDVILAKGPEDD